MRPFSVLAPNKSSGDRVKDLKAKHIFKDAKLSFKKNVNRCNNFNNTIRFTKQGGLKSTESNELRQLLARGYSLCEDGICDSNSVVCDISSTSIKKRGLLNCSHSNMASAVKIDTNTNLFSHFVQQLLPSQGDKPIPMIASYDPSYCAIDISYGIIIDPKCSTTHSDGAGIIFDPSGLYVDSCATGGGGAISGIEKQKHLWNSTAILGSNDISGQYQVCQGGGGVNLSWGNNTKQNYLVSYNPTNKIRFGINPQAKKIVACDVTTATAIAAAIAAAIADANAAAALVTLGAQPVDADLTAIAGLTSAANKGIQFTGSGSAGVYDLTAAGKALLDDADATAQRAAGLLHQCLDPGYGMPSANPRQTLLHKNSIIVIQWHHIGDCPKRHEIEIAGWNFRCTTLPFLFKHAPDSGHEVKGHTDTGQVTARENAALKIRIDDNLGGGKFIAWQVVIRDQYLDTKLIRPGDTVNTGNTVIYRDQQLRRLLRRDIDDLRC